MNGDLSTDHLDYLQRASATETLPSQGPWTTAPPMLRRLSRIDGIGRFEKRRVADAVPAPTRRSNAQPGSAGDGLGGIQHHATQDVLIGLHGFTLPVAYVVRGREGQGVSVELGTWSPVEREAASAQVLDSRQALVESLLQSLHPLVAIGPSETFGALELPLSGLATGIPTVKPADDSEDTAALDRLIRAMGDANWQILVLAEPVDEGLGVGLRRDVINEMRSAQTAQQAELAPSPLAQHYVELLTVLLSSLTLGYSVGMWRTAVYLSGDATSYDRLSATWRAVFSGESSLPEPIRVRDLASWQADQRNSAVGWGMPDEFAPQGPGAYRHPFQYQTLLNSSQLSAYVHFPRQETPGFSISLVPRFDTVSRPETDEPTIRLGRVVQGARLTSSTYRVPVRSLSRHAFVAGVTGSGKTNTVFHLIREAAAVGVPFLVLEPAKAEYRSLLADPDVGAKLQVFTLGDETVSPFRINPFEVPQGTSVGQHLDLLRAVFGSSFGMWTPLPQVLERCLHEVYADRGWDLATNENDRLDPTASAADRRASYPTLGDLVSKVDDVVPRLGYDDRATDDIRAALVTRLGALRTGGKGRMLDCREGLPLDDLLSGPAILELESIGDDDDKAFLMALLLVRLAEYRREQGETDELRHLLVVEEAHRVLSAAPIRTAEEQADPRGKAVETFSQLLSEVRAYGQGVVIADQVPVRLAPDVIKNTALKVAHRTVAADDRAALAGAMAMDEQQMTAVTILAQGEAAVFGIGDDAPVLVRMPPAKVLGRPTDPEVAERMATWRVERGLGLVLHPSEVCRETCQEAPDACQAARILSGDRSLQRAMSRIALSTTEEPGALDRQWDDFVGLVRARRPRHIGEAALLRSLAGHLSEWLAERRGAQAEWDYGATREYEGRLVGMLLERLSGGSGDARDAFGTFAREVHVRTFDPYPGCSAICDQAEPPLCLYRHAMADLVVSSRYRSAWAQAEEEDAQREEPGRAAAWDVSQDAGYEAIEFPEEDLAEELRSTVTGGARRASLCFAQQMVFADEGRVPRAARRIVSSVMWEAGVGGASREAERRDDRDEDGAADDRPAGANEGGGGS